MSMRRRKKTLFSVSIWHAYTAADGARLFKWTVLRQYRKPNWRHK